MKGGTVSDFIDCLTRQEADVLYKGTAYYFDGLHWNQETERYEIGILRRGESAAISGEIYACSDRNPDVCMQKFLHDVLWDGKTIWELEPDLEWTDL